MTNAVSFVFDTLMPSAWASRSLSRTARMLRPSREVRSPSIIHTMNSAAMKHST